MNGVSIIMAIIATSIIIIILLLLLLLVVVVVVVVVVSKGHAGNSPARRVGDPQEGNAQYNNITWYNAI